MQPVTCLPRSRFRSTRTGGFTLLEVLVALTLFSALGYGVMLAIGTGRDSNRAMDEVADEDRGLRAASTALADDLRASNEAHVVITEQPDGNHAVQLQIAIESAGALTWGVHERALGSTSADQDRVGWSVRYSVAVGASGKELRRSVLDAADAVQRSSVLARGLNDAAGAPGFRLVREGAVWAVTLASKGVHAGQPSTRTIFHVTNRNE
ncbi:MAG: prepilin-type N-terminal cleavage/methylation domain-containing protein [Planctomycetes bacterium]|nr:prepilin-type N-terminal cleavage/methylation domain-containing protein [Planctomycetota bacterium]